MTYRSVVVGVSRADARVLSFSCPFVDGQWQRPTVPCELPEMLIVTVNYRHQP